MRASMGEVCTRCGLRGAREGKGRTKNLPYMLVTLEVSKFTVWLNDDARCAESGGVVL